MKATIQRLRALCDLVVSVYGPANRAAFGFLKTVEAIEHLEQDLATQAMRDLPGYPSNDLYLEDRQCVVAPPTPRGVGSGPVNSAGDTSDFLNATAFLKGTESGDGDHDDGVAADYSPIL
jgi:hypothetical protein